MKNKDLLVFFNIKGKLREKKLPMRLAYAIKLNYEKLKPYADAYNEQLLELKERYRQEDVSVGQTETDTELTELLNMDVACEIQTVPMTEFEKCDSGQFDSLTFEELEALGFMINQQE